MADVRQRIVVGFLSLSFAGGVALVVSEGYSDKAIVPVKGDVPTIGFGSTKGVKMGDTTTPPAALARAEREIRVYEGALKGCVKVPLYQHEYDAGVQLAYNIGGEAFCRSTVVRRWNAGDYAGGCEAFLMWNKFQGRELPGLTARRQRERNLCLGLS